MEGLLGGAAVSYRRPRMEREETGSINARGGQAKYSKDAVPEMWLALNPNGRTAT